MAYYMLFQPSAEYPNGMPLDVHLSQDGVNALAVFSSDELAMEGKALAGDEFYMEEVRPDDVLSLAALTGISYIAVDPVGSRIAKCFEAHEAPEALGREHVAGRKREENR
jgi:hypothetical protein